LTVNIPADGGFALVGMNNQCVCGGDRRGGIIRPGRQNSQTQGGNEDGKAELFDVHGASSKEAPPQRKYSLKSATNSPTTGPRTKSKYGGGKVTVLHAMLAGKSQSR
jgi:hypothetical protein